MGVPVPQREGMQNRHQCRWANSDWHSWDIWWTALKSKYDSHSYNPSNKSSKWVHAQAEISQTDMLRFILTTLLSTHEFLSFSLSTQFETLHIYPGQHITAKLRSSFHGPTQAEIHCADLIWQVLDDQPTREYEKWLWDSKVGAAIGFLWICWLSGRMSWALLLSLCAVKHVPSR